MIEIGKNTKNYILKNRLMKKNNSHFFIVAQLKIEKNLHFWLHEKL